MSAWEREVALGRLGEHEAFALASYHATFIKVVRPGTDDGVEFDLDDLLGSLASKGWSMTRYVQPTTYAYRRDQRLDAAVNGTARDERSIMVCVLLHEEPVRAQLEALAGAGLTVPIDDRPRVAFHGTLSPRDIEALESHGVDTAKGSGWVYKIAYEGRALPVK